jgi:precorrin-2 dehydrogenase/sirohydrochlorin ferrochelatase
MSQYYPVFLKVQDKVCLVAGGGSVAARKVKSLLECGATVRIVSPELTPTLRELVEQGRAGWVPEPYSEEALADAFLVVAATGDAAVNRQVAADCERRGLPANIVDAPELCSFVVPAVVRRGELVIAVSTGGASPALARRIREQLEAQFDETYSVLPAALGAARDYIRQNVPDPVRRKELLTALGAADLLAVLKEGGPAALSACINNIIGGTDVWGNDCRRQP